MIFAFDSYYYDDKAKTVALSFNEWDDAVPNKIYTEVIKGIEEYVPGAFYRRELPCIIHLLRQINLEKGDVIVVDGFVYLDDNKSFGLGAHLYHALNSAVPVIGVAKTNFASIEKLKQQVYRGESKNPLYVTSIGLNLDTAAEYISQMHGSYRIPALLKQLDILTKEQ